jgi:hypothetical protein
LEAYRKSGCELPIRFKRIVIKGIQIPQHPPDPWLHSLLLPPVNKIYSWNHATFTGFGIRLDILPNLPFFHNPPQSAICPAADVLSDLGQSFLLDDIFVLFHGRLLKKMKLADPLFRKISPIEPSFKLPTEA